MPIKKLRYLGLLAILGLLAFLNLAYGSFLPGLEATPTPGPKVKPVSLAAQAGNSDLIVVLGIMIFVLIAVPILLHFRKPKKS
jgi:hypothetical protein